MCEGRESELTDYAVSLWSGRWRLALGPTYPCVLRDLVIKKE